MRIVGVIPARLDSKRFPGKALALLQGKEVILHVFQNSRAFKDFERLIVATDNLQIKSLIESHGGEVYYSQTPYRNGSERAAAAIIGIDCDICVNVQGDEVFVTSDSIDAVVRLLKHDQLIVASTAAFPVKTPEKLSDRNLVKVVVDQKNTAINFSRIPITSNNGSQPINYGHAGIYAYRRPFLLRYPELPQTRGELAESLEQLRILESGEKIGVAILKRPLLSINTPEDLVLANKMISTEGGVG